MVLSRFDRIERKEIRKFSFVRAILLKYVLVCFTVRLLAAKLRKPNHNRNFLATFGWLHQTMELHQRIAAFGELGRRLPGLLTDELCGRVNRANPWFTASEIRRAGRAWSELLIREKLESWTCDPGTQAPASCLDVLVIAAGNIPMVGFHDFLSVLITGNRFYGRLSSRDDILIREISGELTRIEPGFQSLIRFDDPAGTPDAVIATGSNNTSRYFRLKYGEIPHIFRRTRSSAAILDGMETDGEIQGLASDILDYYGLGCRSISHIYLPEGASPEKLTVALTVPMPYDECQPLTDNIRYQRARLEMLGIPFTDAGRVLIAGSENIHSPIGVVHVSHYRDAAILMESLAAREEEIQCLTGHSSLGMGLVPFGSAQYPGLGDYADHVNTLEFLSGLNQSSK